MTIVEHRTDGENVVGEINGSGVSRDRLTLSWSAYYQDQAKRMTDFLPSCWKCDTVAGVIFLKRIAEDPPDGKNNPSPHADLYILFKQAK
ncbi:MAG: hypothetical protein ABII19_01645 [Patescibacteria group bacterium]